LPLQLSRQAAKLRPQRWTARASDEQSVTLRASAQVAVQDHRRVAVGHFAAVYALLCGTACRPTPPVLELIALGAERSRYAVLLDGPEPLDWSRLGVECSVPNQATGHYTELLNVAIVWNIDGSKAIICCPGGMADGRYRLDSAYRLDLGVEAPLLRRAGSALPEVAALEFSRSRPAGATRRAEAPPPPYLSLSPFGRVGRR